MEQMLPGPCPVSQFRPEGPLHPAMPQPHVRCLLRGRRFDTLIPSTSPPTSCHGGTGNPVLRWLLGHLIRRNQNYMNILRFLALGDKKLSPFNITHRFTHLFWLGDLNYRVELPTSVRSRPPGAGAARDRGPLELAQVRIARHTG